MGRDRRRALNKYSTEAGNKNWNRTGNRTVRQQTAIHTSKIGRANKNDGHTNHPREKGHASRQWFAG